MLVLSRAKILCPKAKTGLSSGSVVKNLLADAGDTGLIPASGRSPEEGNDIPHHDSCLGNPMDRGVWGATVHGVTKSHTQLSD